MWVVLVPVKFTAVSETVLDSTVSVVCLLIAFAFGLWSTRKIEADFILHGSLVGVVAALIYMILARDPAVYEVANALKIIGGAVGGYVALRQNKSVAEAGT